MTPRCPIQLPVTANRVRVFPGSAITRILRINFLGTAPLHNAEWSKQPQTG